MFKLLALGDSYLQGYAVEEGEGVIAQLVELLKKRTREPVVADIIARGGWKAETLKGALDQAVPGLNSTDPHYNKALYDYNMVVLLIGANDITVGNATLTYIEQLSSLMQRAIKLTGNDPSKVVVCSLPALGHTPYAHNPQTFKQREAVVAVKNRIAEKAAYNTLIGLQATVTEYNASIEYMIQQWNKDQPSNSCVRFVDLYELSLESTITDKKGNHLPDKSAFDSLGVHYTAQMYRKWAKALLPHVLEIYNHGSAPDGATLH